MSRKRPAKRLTIRAGRHLVRSAGARPRYDFAHMARKYCGNDLNAAEARALFYAFCFSTAGDILEAVRSSPELSKGPAAPDFKQYSRTGDRGRSGNRATAPAEVMCEHFAKKRACIDEACEDEDYPWWDEDPESPEERLQRLALPLFLRTPGACEVLWNRGSVCSHTGTPQSHALCPPRCRLMQGRARPKPIRFRRDAAHVHGLAERHRPHRLPEPDHRRPQPHHRDRLLPDGHQQQHARHRPIRRGQDAPRAQAQPASDGLELHRARHQGHALPRDGTMLAGAGYTVECLDFANICEEPRPLPAGAAHVGYNPLSFMPSRLPRPPPTSRTSSPSLSHSALSRTGRSRSGTAPRQTSLPRSSHT